MAPPRKGDLSPEEKDLLGVIATGEPGLALAPLRRRALVLPPPAWLRRLHLAAGWQGRRPFSAASVVPEEGLEGRAAAGVLQPLLAALPPPAGSSQPRAVGTAGLPRGLTRACWPSRPSVGRVLLLVGERSPSVGQACAVQGMPGGGLPGAEGACVAVQHSQGKPRCEGLTLPRKVYIFLMRIHACKVHWRLSNDLY